MPTVLIRGGYREKLLEHAPIINALMARPVGKAEIAREPKAKEACDKQWNRLEKIRCWIGTSMTAIDTVIARWCSV